jgi:hypothetical protein
LDRKRPETAGHGTTECSEDERADGDGDDHLDQGETTLVAMCPAAPISMRHH